MPRQTIGWGTAKGIDKPLGVLDTPGGKVTFVLCFVFSVYDIIVNIFIS